MASSLVQFRTEDTSRIKAASICEQLGIDLPTYLRACIARLIQENGIPFSMKLEPKPESRGLQAMKEGLLEIFIEAGAVVSTPTCGPCLGGYMGILAAGERCISTTNRNFVGRMGHVDSEVYLASPAVAAASAVAGKIICPCQLD